MLLRASLAALALLFGIVPVNAEPPVASYIFPAGGQRGTAVKVRVGGLFLNKTCTFDMQAPGIQASAKLLRGPTLWFEGPLLELPDSQRQEDYPKDMTGDIRLAPDAAPGLYTWRLATSQGSTPSKLFQVGDLPEIIEDEIDGEPIAVAVKLPVTINGRIFPRQDVDAWSFTAKKGETVMCEVFATRLGSPLDAHLEIRDATGKRLAESDLGGDPRLAFAAPADGTYQVRIHDINNAGSQSHVYRLTLRNGPFVENVFPLGGKRGTSLIVELKGHQLPAPTIAINLPNQGDSASHQLPGGNAFALDLDDLPEYLEKSSAQTIAVPAVCNGRILKPGEVDAWTLAAKKGDNLQLELRAARLGSPLDGILSIADDTGKELARAEATGSLDPIQRFSVAKDGNYQVRVQDRFRSRGGPAYAYRLRISPAGSQPDFRLSLKLDALTLLRGSTVKLPVQLERIGNFSDAVNLAVEGLPAGVTVTGTSIAAKQNQTELTFKTDADAPVKSSRLTIRGTTKLDGKDVTRTALWSTPLQSREVDTVLAAVGIPTPFKVKGVFDMRWAPRGSLHQRRYQIERGGFDGPLEVALTDKQARHLQGVQGAPITVPAGATEFDYSVQLPPWMETGRTSRVCVMATGIHKDKDGSLHELTFSSVHQNEQMVAVIEPGKLEIALERTSIRSQPDLPIPFKVTRSPGLKGPVRIELVLPSHLKDVRAEAVNLSDGQNEGTLHILLGRQPGPFNLPLVLRATLTSDARPFVAECSLEVVP